VDERQYLLEAIKKDLALIKRIEDRLRGEDDPRRQLKLETDNEELWQRIRDRKAHLSSLDQEELKKTVSYLGLPPLKLEPLPLPEPLIPDEDSSSISLQKQLEDKPPITKFHANYSKLCKLLKAGKWREADLETARLMLEVSKRQNFGWLRARDIENFPCQDIRIINNLWVNFSQSKFGFSTQRNIWRNVGGQPGEFDGYCFLKFGNRVGWRRNDDWLKYNDLSFSLDAPKGHLPSLQLTGLRNEPDWLSLWKSNFKSFLSHIETCLSNEYKN